MGEEIVEGFGRKARRKEPLGRIRRRWKDGIRMDLREIGWWSAECIHLAQDRDQCRALVNTVMDMRVTTPQIYLLR
jgi:hypothetical protein